MSADTRQRLDKWLWFARVVKARSLAQSLVTSGAIRLNGGKVTKPGHSLCSGDVLTIAVHGRVRVLRVVALASRRGPASEAKGLYTEQYPPTPMHSAQPQKVDASCP